MPERRQAASSNTSTSTSNGRPTVRRNLFHQHLRASRPTSSSTSTSAETLRLDIEPEFDTSDIVIRDQDGQPQIGDPAMQAFDEQDEEAHADHVEDDRKERQRLADAVKHHQRDRNRAPSEPAELLEAVRASLRVKVAALSEDNWMYEAEDEPTAR